MEGIGAMGLDSSIVVHDVACLKWAASNDPPFSLVPWGLSLYNFHFFWGYAVSPERAGQMPGSAPVGMPWPRPR
jgi:hypothetical protein